MILVRFMNLKFLRWTRRGTGRNFKFTALGRHALPSFPGNGTARRKGIIFATLTCLLVLAPSAQPAVAQTSIVVPGGGEITTSARVENGVLAISNQVVRNPRGVRECFGICLYASKSVSKNWICRQSNCALDCSAREPVGGC